MSSSAERIAANRANALNSTGPKTEAGKMAARSNATRHGLLSTRLILDDECAEDYAALVLDLHSALRPVGGLECALFERIAITLWRQRRLVAAETAHLGLARSPRQVARGIRFDAGGWAGGDITEETLEPVDSTQIAWCRSVLSEIENLGEIAPHSLAERAPLVHAQLKTDAEDEDPFVFAAAQAGGLTGYVHQLYAWCQQRVTEAEQRPALLALAEQVRAKRLILPPDAIDVLSRYQTTLDNQLYKALRALREAQEWRLKTLDGSPVQRPGAGIRDTSGAD